MLRLGKKCNLYCAGDGGNLHSIVDRVGLFVVKESLVWWKPLFCFEKIAGFGFYVLLLQIVMSAGNYTCLMLDKYGFLFDWNMVIRFDYVQYGWRRNVIIICKKSH